MKSVILKMKVLLFILIVFAVNAKAENRLYIPESNVTPGDVFELPLWIDTDKDYLGMQVDIMLPKGVEFELNNRGKLIVSLNPEIVDDHIAASNVLDTGVGRILVASMTNSTILKGNNLLMTVKVKITDSFSGSQTGKVSNIRFSPVPGEEDIFSPEDFTLNVKLSSLSFDKTDLTLEEGKESSLGLVYNPVNAEGIDVAFTVADPSIISYTDGVVKALKKGSTTITATAQGISATCKVNVTEPQPSSVSLSKTELQMFIGDEESLIATVLPINADQSVIWSSSDASVVKVENGIVTALKVGNATVTATTSNGLKANCSVVVKPVLAESIILSAETLNLLVGDTDQLTATVMPANTTDKSVSWFSSDISVATVENGKVTAISAGKVTITATTNDDSNLSATCEVIVDQKTGIESIASDALVDVYDINGRLLIRNTDVKTLKSLKKGIYIIKAESRTFNLIR